jgi:hypothetical protein
MLPARVGLESADLLRLSLVAGPVFQRPFQNAYLICAQCKSNNQIKAHDIGRGAKAWQLRQHE